jgi:hypothetical protein
MSREFNPIAARMSRRDSQRHARVLRATCLLCRVLWPIVVQHRHLIFDSSSEANTVFLTPKRPRGPRYTTRCSHVPVHL